MRGITEGDIVRVYWVIDGEILTGEVLSIPYDVGDLWYIKDEKGNIHAINSGCSNFESIIKFKEEKTVPLKSERKEEV